MKVFEPWRCGSNPPRHHHNSAAEPAARHGTSIKRLHQEEASKRTVGTPTNECWPPSLDTRVASSNHPMRWSGVDGHAHRPEKPLCLKDRVSGPDDAGTRGNLALGPPLWMRQAGIKPGLQHSTCGAPPPLTALPWRDPTTSQSGSPPGSGRAQEIA